MIGKTSGIRPILRQLIANMPRVARVLTPLVVITGLAGCTPPRTDRVERRPQPCAPCVCPDAGPAPVIEDAGPAEAAAPPVPPTITLLEGSHGLVTLANGRDAVVTKARSGATAIDLRVNIETASFGQPGLALPAGLTAELQTAEGANVATGLNVAAVEANGRQILRVSGNLPENAQPGTLILVIKDADGNIRFRIADALRLSAPRRGGGGHGGGQSDPCANIPDPLVRADCQARQK